MNLVRIGRVASSQTTLQGSPKRMVGRPIKYERICLIQGLYDEKSRFLSPFKGDLKRQFLLMKTKGPADR